MKENKDKVYYERGAVELRGRSIRAQKTCEMCHQTRWLRLIRPVPKHITEE